MGIDGIGKSGKLTDIATPATTAASASSPQATFEVGRTSAVEKSKAVSPLDQLREGTIDLDRYLDLKVEQATAGLENKLDPERLDFIRSTLRSQLANDPVLGDLVKMVSSAVNSANNER
jgi:hypothetical protein